ncbi:hypothetical protein MMC16_007938 [Acarospora aff. strigata]|nr:hypothetical protein [Acarospora aff. strigata]
MFKALSSMGYEWVIRVDDDSGFPESIPYDIVSVMEAKEATYGFRTMNQDSKAVTKALAEAAKYWLVSEDITPSFLFQFCNPASLEGVSTEGWFPHIFYNNFFVTRVQFWLRPDVQDWLTHLENVNGFYKFRWGDAPVQTVTLAIFAPIEHLVEFRFEYEHQGFYAANQTVSVLQQLVFPHDTTLDLLGP